MILLKINSKLLIVVILFLMAGMFSLSIYNYKCNLELAKKLEFIECAAIITNSTGMISFLASTNTNTLKDDNVEVFDISKGKVVKRVKVNDYIQSEAKKYIKGITNIYVKVKAFPDKGQIIKIPLSPPVKVSNQWFEGTVDRVFIIFPENEKPYLLILDENERPMFYNFEGSAEELLNSIGNF